MGSSDCEMALAAVRTATTAKQAVIAMVIRFMIALNILT